MDMRHLRDRLTLDRYSAKSHDMAEEAGVQSAEAKSTVARGRRPLKGCIDSHVAYTGPALNHFFPGRKPAGCLLPQERGVPA